MSGALRSWLRTLVLSVPIPQSRQRRGAEAQSYWTDEGGPRWAANSHVIGHVPGWEKIGPAHRAMFESFAQATQADSKPRRVLEWGSGGGANAVAFAPQAEEFVAVDVSPSLLDECKRRVAQVCATPVMALLVGVNTPEDVLNLMPAGGLIDLFLCLYVIELLPSKDHARRIMQVAARLLRPGGSALVQVKYRTRSPWTRPRTWSYRRQVAAMTSFDIDEFWHLSEACGLQPRLMTLVPENELDERYAYFFLTRRGST